MKSAIYTTCATAGPPYYRSVLYSGREIGSRSHSISGDPRAAATPSLRKWWAAYATGEITAVHER
jgi:hypothetical protein